MDREHSGAALWCRLEPNVVGVVAGEWESTTVRAQTEIVSDRVQLLHLVGDVCRKQSIHVGGKRD